MSKPIVEDFGGIAAARDALQRQQNATCFELAIYNAIDAGLRYDKDGLDRLTDIANNYYWAFVEQISFEIAVTEDDER